MKPVIGCCLLLCIFTIVTDAQSSTEGWWDSFKGSVEDGLYNMGLTSGSKCIPPDWPCDYYGGEYCCSYMQKGCSRCCEDRITGKYRNCKCSTRARANANPIGVCRD